MAEGDGLDPVNGAQTPAPEARSALNPTGAVFISYASQDAALATELCAALERASLTCWIAPRDVRPGDFYADAIVNAINACPVLVLVLSKNSVDSAHVLREVERASSKRRPIIAFRIDTTALPAGLEYFLSASQWIDASAGSPERGFPKLVESLRGRITSTPKSDSAAQLAVSQPGKRGLNRIIIVVTAVVGTALVYGIVDRFWLSKHVTAWQRPTTATNVVSDKSIAVLPFVDLSEKKDQEYFADGMAEEILDLLVKIPGLTVIGRTSSFQFKGKSDDLRSIGTKLNAAYILEGSVRKASDRLRVTAQLIESQSGTHLWSDTYDRDMTDVLKLQDEIAAGIARALEVTVGAHELRQGDSIRNIDAYRFYLLGLHAVDRYDKDSLDEAASDFQKSLEIDPALANAAGKLADTRAKQAILGFIDYASGFEDARHLAENSIRLDPSLAIGHAVLALFYNDLAWDWAAADREAKRAIALDPQGVYPLTVSASLAATLGHWDEAIGLLNTALALDPLSADLYWYLGNTRYRQGRLPEAETAFRRALQISPTYVSIHFELGRVLLARGQLRDALSAMEQESPEPASGRTAGLCIVYYALGRRSDSDAALRRLETEDWPFGMAEVHAFRGEADKALQWLDQAYTAKDELYLIKGDPMFEKIGQDPRFKAFLRKMNLVE